MTHAENAIINRMSQQKPSARPSVIEKAEVILRENLVVKANGEYLLSENGRWNRVNLSDVMRAANTRLKNLGSPQITLNPRWEVK
jgi:hypothetical protein